MTLASALRIPQPARLPLCLFLAGLIALATHAVAETRAPWFERVGGGAACPGGCGDALAMTEVRAQGIHYSFGEGGDMDLHVYTTGEAEKRTIAVGMDCVSAAAATDERTPVLLFLAGCRGDVSVLRVFRDDTGDQRADAFLGEYELPRHISLDSLAIGAHDGPLYGYDARRGQILRFEDADDNGVPEGHAIYVQLSESDAKAAPWSLGIGYSGRMTLEDPGCCRSDPIYVVDDEDGDGRPERAELTCYAYEDRQGPGFLHPPRVDDEAFHLHTNSWTQTEVWRTDAQGRRLSADPAQGRLQMGWDEEEGGWRLAEGEQLRLGEFLVVYDEEAGRHGAPMRVHGNYPIPERREPSQLPLAEGGVITVNGTGFGRDTRVELVMRGRSYPLVPEGLPGTRFTVVVPPLPHEKPGFGRLRITSPESPADLRALMRRCYVRFE